jgi:hypothetical protein
MDRPARSQSLYRLSYPAHRHSYKTFNIRSSFFFSEISLIIFLKIYNFDICEFFPSLFVYILLQLLRLDENILLLTLTSLIDMNYSVPTRECVKLTAEPVLILENKSRPISDFKKNI